MPNKTLNQSGLGVHIGDTTLAVLALADDQVLLSNTHGNTQALINSALHLLAQNNNQYVPSKTKILVTNPKPSKSTSQSIPPGSSWTVGEATITISS